MLFGFYIGFCFYDDTLIYFYVFSTQYKIDYSTYLTVSTCMYNIRKANWSCITIAALARMCAFEHTRVYVICYSISITVILHIGIGCEWSITGGGMGKVVGRAVGSAVSH